MRRFLKFLHGFLCHMFDRISSLRELFSTKSLYEGECYFPEVNKRKSKKAIFWEQFIHILKCGYCNKFYFLYGFDVVGFRKESDYVDYTCFMKKRDKHNFSTPLNPIAILRDKSLFGITASAYGIQTPKVVGMITNGNDLFLYKDKISVKFDDFLKSKTYDLFLKVVDGECADGVYHIISDTHNVTHSGETMSIADYVNSLNINTRYIIQEKISQQHAALSAIYPTSINTIRLVTVIDPMTNIPCVLSAVLRVGCGISEVDNWAVGGLCIGIQESGELEKYAFYKPGFGTKISTHPNSGIIFEGYKIPYFNEAISEAIRFHKILGGIHSIGWDIAITENGPSFIEGNDNWEISMLQMTTHGMQKEFAHYFK